MIPPQDPLETVAQALQHQPGVADWQAQKITRNSTQLFLIGNQTEARRLVNAEQIQVSVYNDHPPRNQPPAGASSGAGAIPEEGPGGGTPSGAISTASLARGAANRILLAEEIADQARLERALEESTFIASLTDNPPYRLPDPPVSGFPAVETEDKALIGSDDARLAALGELRERLLAAVAAEPGIRLSSAELFATASQITLRNSRGILATRNETDLLCALVLIASDGAQAAEYYSAPQRRRLADLDIEALVRRSARYARDSLRVSMPSTYEGPVVISGQALVDLFSPLVFHTSARAAYQSMSRFALGAPICGEQEVRGDHLTFISNALLPYGQTSAPFSDEGVPGERVILIQNSQHQAWWAEQRYADYLNIRPTGSFANIEIPPGTHAAQDLLEGDGPLYHLVAFSWLNPDELTGDFVAEIKLGYRLEHGQAAPIKGGSLSGNLFDALAEVRFSRETQFTGGYTGPEALRFEYLTISGG
jgi:predicted Zn-dependent protease